MSMPDWKVRQNLFHKIFADTDLGDDLRNEEIVMLESDDEVVAKALAYPSIQTKELYYPAKSFSIAITYAYLIEKHFGNDFYSVLDDPELLFGNDPYFMPYSERKEVYDRIIKDFPKDILNEPEKGCLNFQLTYEYFLKEFLLSEETKIYAPD